MTTVIICTENYGITIFMVITVHQLYQSLYYPTDAQRKIRRVN